MKKMKGKHHHHPFLRRANFARVYVSTAAGMAVVRTPRNLAAAEPPARITQLLFRVLYFVNVADKSASYLLLLPPNILKDKGKKEAYTVHERIAPKAPKGLSGRLTVRDAVLPGALTSPRGHYRRAQGQRAPETSESVCR